MKDIKTLLKECREAIKNKDYVLSLKLSKTILREDKSNYMAMVFLGLSLQEVGPAEQAIKAFQKAIEMNPSNPLAWNGLIKYYEKLEDDEVAKKKLVQPYISAIRLETDTKKIIEYCNKLSKIQEFGDINEISKVIYECGCKLKENNGIIYEILVDLYNSLQKVPNSVQLVFEEIFGSLISEKKFLNTNIFSVFLNSLYKQDKNEEVFKHAENLHSLSETDIIPLIWMCKIYNQWFVEDSDLSKTYYEKIKCYFPCLLKIDSKNAIGLFTSSIVLLNENKLLEAKNTIVEVCTQRSGLIHAWVLLTKINLYLGLFEDAWDSYSSGDKLMKSTNYSNQILKNIMDTLFLKLLSNSPNEEDLLKVSQFYKNMDDQNSQKENLKYVITALIRLGNFEEANLLISKFKEYNEELARLLLAKLYHQQKCFQQSLSILEENTPDLPEWWLEIGLVYWSLGEFSKCLTPYLRAAKADPNNFNCFINLGQYYEKFEDLDKARRCYERAFKINPKYPEIGIKLSKIYRRQNNFEASHNLLQSLATGSITPRTSWAWLQLGLSYLEQENYSSAIDNLQPLVRIEPNNTLCWQTLGDAYFARGSYTSALKCYQKAVEFTSNPLYPSLQIANIKKTLGLYKEAKSEFEEILLSNGQYVPALKGLAETFLSLAKECYQDQRLGIARDLAQNAINNLTTAITQRSDFSCLWKLIGDSCLFVLKLPEKYCCIFVSEMLMEGKKLIEREDLYCLATSCYCKSISLAKDNSSVWFDLATCYLEHALHTTNDEKRDLLLTYAKAAAKHCVSMDPSNWQHWNLLGNIEMQKEPQNYAMAQHYFIKAVTIEKNCAISWTNLGVLYLMKKDLRLANKAFAQGQRSDPNYVSSWIGQAMIAEAIDSRKEEAMDLYRHSVQLGQNQQGALGYAHWVCHTLLTAEPNSHLYSIEDMHAIPVACDALTWYTERNESDGCAWNMLGLLRERMGLKEGTLHAFKKAYQLSSQHRDLARVNYGRILAKSGNYPAAINIFQEVQDATFSSGSGLALALFQSKHYEESYIAYEQTLRWLTQEQSHESELLVALASMAYMFQGPDTAKTLLDQSRQLTPPSPWSLYSTLALGLLHKDMELADRVKRELELLKDNSECLPHYASLLSCMLLLQSSNSAAVSEISKLVHRHPENDSLWLTLALLLLQVRKDKKQSAAAVKCAQIAIKSGQKTTDISKVLVFVSLASVLVGDKRKAIITAQKAVHSYPNMTDGWAVLALCLTDPTRRKCSKTFVLNLFSHIETLNVTRELLEWSKNHSKFVK
ncbi:tetratricopeptide repeat protein 37 [Leptinotarsa decemlineata]|uniref:tetratricopeptide repeat protein 37 n=1 Tax=Leptinotarsa decemlineata TaxID=7539 RepID=UPI003D30D79E